MNDADDTDSMHVIDLYSRVITLDNQGKIKRKEMKTLGERIRQMRINIGWTQERLAREAGLSKSF